MLLKDKILNLRSEGLTYTQIVITLKCSKSTVAYYCGQGQKDKNAERGRKNRKKAHPFVKKIETFSRTPNNKYKQSTLTLPIRHRIRDKIKTFHREYKSMDYTKPLFSVDDVIQKFGEHPICYLTGEVIDIYKPSTYNFDHIIPRSRGGTNDIDNLAICTSHANQAKGNMTPDEFINLCKKIVKYNDSQKAQ